MPADPVAAGRKGGQSRSPAKLAACRRNGFQKVHAQNVQEQATQATPLLLIASPSSSSPTG
jgi:hypothetical protein